MFGLGFGGNTPETPACFRRAATYLGSAAGVTKVRISRVYLTPPWGNAAGGDFMNFVAAGEWSGSDHGLLELCREIEALCGAPVNKLGDSRSIDADILFIEDGVTGPELWLPHPRMHLRRFVLVPLGEVFDGLVPGFSRTVGELLAQTPDESHITLCEGFSFD
ncbi:MAG: 2-amino-4-hydroxy-6-hydroxymethyldihydropteridine diphosphokinase [Candidatus Fermentibacteraceae bacterium]